MNIVGNVAAIELEDRNLEIAFEDFDSHGCLLLTYTLEGAKSRSKVRRTGAVAPDLCRISVEVTIHPLGSGRYPNRHHVHKTVQHGSLMEGSANRLSLGGQTIGVKMTEPIVQLPG
jgi:hypothetical protein